MLLWLLKRSRGNRRRGCIESWRRWLRELRGVVTTWTNEDGLDGLHSVSEALQPLHFGYLTQETCFNYIGLLASFFVARFFGYNVVQSWEW